MKKYFTQLLNTVTNSSNTVKILFAVLFMCVSNSSYANIAITQATGGTDICSNLAVNGSAPAFTTLGDIVFSESAPAEFGNNGGNWQVTVVITPPLGWQFNAATPPTLTFATGANVTAVTQLTYNANVLQMRVQGIGNASLDVVTISGLQVQASSVTSGNGNLNVNAFMGTATGLNNQNVGNLSQLPLPISGTRNVCIGGTVTLSDATAAGVWSSASPGIATVTAGGVVGGGAAGPVSINYTVAGCTTSYSLTVNAPPGTFTGATEVCAGSTTALTNSVAGGTWSSSVVTAATVGANSGVVGGVLGVVNTPSVTVISYTTPGCTAATLSFTVNPRPNVISGTMSVCSGGGTTTLSTNISSGTWTSSNTASATVTLTGVPATVTGGVGGVTVPLTYTLPTGCLRVANVTVTERPSVISGTTTVCTGLTTNLSNTAAGGTWSSSNNTLATVVTATGVVTGVAAGSPNILYNVAACPSATVTVTVNQSPSAISGPTSVCQGYSIVISNSLAGGTWSSSNTNRGTVSPASGPVTTVTAGFTGPVNLTYTVNTCSAVKTVTVNLTPVAITGNTTVCTGFTTILSDATAGGAWTSTNTSVATIAPTRIVSGVTAGASVISYTLATGCFNTTTVTVNQSPAAIGGTLNLCEGFTTTLTDATLGGTWSSSSPANATIGSSGGDIHAVSSGTITVTYTDGTNGCIATTPFVINAAPSSILGNTTVCEAATTTLSNTSPGGVWSSNNPSVATITSAGVVSGVSGGTSVITYDFGTACNAIATVTVNPLPATGTIVGPSFVCLGGTAALSNAVTGGVWTTNNTSVATVSASGVVSGVTAGIFDVIYTVTNGCGTLFTSQTMSVDNVTPGVTISGNPGLNSCEGAPVIYTANPTDGGASPTYVWTVNSTSVATSNPFTYTPAAGDTLRVTMTSNAACLSTPTATDQAILAIFPNLVPSVSISNAPHGDTVCIGTSVPYTATPVNGGTSPVYLWYVNGVPTGSTNPFNYTPNDNDVISVELTSSYQCATPAAVVSNSITMTVDITQTPAVTITSSGNPSCQGGSVTYTAHWLYGGLTPFLRWTQNGINVATGPTFTTIPSNGDQFFCTLKSSSTCRTADSTFSNTIVQIVDQPVVPVANVVATNTTISVGGSTLLTVLVTPLGLSPTYQWYLNGVAISGATSSTYAVVGGIPGTTYYYCLVGNGNSCNTTSISNLVTINVYAVGVEQVTAGSYDVKLVPNPNSGTFNVSGAVPANSGNVTIEVTNMIGQVVYKTTAVNQGDKINEQVSLGSEVANGVYMLHIIANDTRHAIRFSVNR